MSTLVPLPQFVQPRSFVLLPASLTYLPAAQDDHVVHEPSLDEEVYFPWRKHNKEKRFDERVC